MKPMAKLFVRLTLIGSAALPASAQAIFSAATGSLTLVGTGHAELLGEFIVSVVSGTTAAGTLEVEIGLLHEFVEEAADNEDTFVRITSAGGTIPVLAYRGTFDLEEMLFIQGQVAP